MGFISESWKNLTVRMQNDPEKCVRCLLSAVVFVLFFGCAVLGWILGSRHVVGGLFVLAFLTFAVHMAVDVFYRLWDVLGERWKK